jgi:GntR family transcriptional regulator, transcriptional repressor for pyruvate dehydrogenase complex
VDRALRLHQADKPDQRIEEHFNFHVLLAEATGNPVYPLLIRAVVDIMKPVWKKTGSPETLARHTVAFHRKIVSHLMAGDAPGAKRELKRHILEVEKLITASSAKRAPRVARLARAASR